MDSTKADKEVKKKPFKDRMVSSNVIEFELNYIMYANISDKVSC